METLLSTKLFYTAFMGYSGALLAYCVLIGTEKPIFAPVANFFMGSGLALHTLAVLLRMHEFRHLPLASMFEFMIVAAWVAACGYFAVLFFVKNRFVGMGSVVTVVFLMAIVSLLPKEGTSSLMPALRSYWLYIHVSAAAASEGLFSIGCVSSLLYFIKCTLPAGSGLHAKLPDLATLNTITYRSIAAGYPLFTIGALFAGAIWAHRAWGSFWSWDPKETCSLVVWIIYSGYLHIRINRGVRGHLPHILSIAGFTSAVLTFFASMFLGGLHSYR